MITSILSLLSLGGLPAATPAFHAIAFVTDPMSHGLVGDGLLSLNEAIRLHNGTLSINSLSVAEQAQVSLIPGSGGTTDVTWIEIDSELLPTITIEQDLDTIVNTTFGLFIRGGGGIASLDLTGPGITRGMHSTSSNLILQNVEFDGGPSGLEVEQADATGAPGCTLEGCKFQDQTQFALRFTGTQPNAIGRLILEECEIVNVPNAIKFDETVADRFTIFEAHEVRITGVSVGIDAVVGTGGNARFTFDRVIIESSSVGIDLVAPSTNGRPLLIEGNHTRVRAPVCARFDGANDAVTWMQCAMWSLLATPGGTALELGVLGNQVYGDLNEFRCVGDVTIATGGSTLPLTVRNMRGKDGAVTVSTSATQSFAITESRFTDCVTETAGSGAVAINGSCFDGGTIGVSSPAGLLQATGCFLTSSGAGVNATGSLPQAQLGSMEVSPDDPVLGGSIQFSADLPAGLVCGFALGTVAATPPALPAPFYVYVDADAFLFSGVYSAQQSMSWAVPNLPLFRGYELLVQSVVLPLPGLQAPALQLPPGWRFVLR